MVRTCLFQSFIAFQMFGLYWCYKCTGIVNASRVVCRLPSHALTRLAVVAGEPMHGLQGLLYCCRYVFPDEAAASASLDGRSSEYVVARSPEAALQQAQSRCAF